MGCCLDTSHEEKKGEKPMGVGYDYLLRILLIGRPEAGKTSILLRLVDNTFTPSKINTIGVDFKFSTRKTESLTLKLQIWDTHQEKFGSSSSSYYRGAHGILVFYDVTNLESFKDLQKYLQEVDRYACKNVSKLLVGCKCDLVDERVVSTQEAQEFADELNLEYIETSAKSGSNVEEAFVRLATIVKNHLID
eukprot:TRINITY_DN9100_c0_g1_i1.p1 TRINITY_DN9100_c0_g1~~TRINITY_DN9100_c0_g1_i1.p1  ORF type:complete len:192 (-),score=39.87 TRINITY_DN9100_c0_g1_i1:41-616(-)